MLLTLLAALGHAPDLLSYDRLHMIAGHWLFKLAAVAVVFLSLWSAAHRLRITCYDLGVRADIAVAAFVYAGALAGTVFSVLYLARI
jgi:fumarate reductase subunit D